MRVVANNDHLNCRRINNTELVNPAITTDTKVRDLLKLQEEQLSLWASFVYQKVVGQLGAETIVTNVEEQYIKPLHNKYMGYNKRSILEMIAQLGTWFTITNTENMKMRTYFESPWSDTPNSHVKTFATQLDKRHLECADFTVTISNVVKTIFFVRQMDLSGLYENEFLEDYDESDDQSWETTVEVFTKKYDREIWRTKKVMGKKYHKSASALRERNRDRNRDRNLGATQEAPAEASTSTMGYITALEER